MSGGGTAGHIYPALALADKLKARGDEVLYVGTPDGLEARLVTREHIDFVSIEASGFNRSKPWTLITSGIKVLSSSFKASRIIEEFGADAAMCFGGYVAIPVGMAAIRKDVPLFVHEQNSVLGMTNRYLAKNAEKVFVTYENTVADVSAISDAQVVHSGNPVRPEFHSQNRELARTEAGLLDEDILIFVFGGSRGARHINQTMRHLYDRLMADERIRVIHATGDTQYDEVVESFSDIELDERYLITPFVTAMARALSATDIAICRAGATTIAEITALGVPSILIPYPYATDDHQTTNASVLAHDNAAFVFADDQLDSSEFTETLMRMIDDENLRQSMARATRSLALLDAAQTMADGIYSTLDDLAQQEHSLGLADAHEDTNLKADNSEYEE